MKRDIRFLLTNKCNYNCYFCHNEGVSVPKRNTEMTINDYTTLYSIYSKLENWNGVTLSGGEPLIYKNIFDLTKKLYKMGAEITIVTNGYLIKNNLDLFKYINRVNVSIHTLNEDIYSKIVGKQNVLNTVLSNLTLLRNTYPKLQIRLNVTPTKNMNWSSELINDLISFSKNINASLKFTELFSKSNSNCIPLNDIKIELIKRNYKEIDSHNRYRYFQNKKHIILITQCTCSKAIEFSEPIEYCRNTHDLYVNHTGEFLLCRLGDESIYFLEELKSKNYESLKNKIKLAQRRISNSLCISRLK